jgi:cell wall-associated NlpC family hydrolase
MVVEDDYPAWLAPQDFAQLHPTTQAYSPPRWSAAEIRDRLPQVIAFAQAAMAVPNHYLWGGTVAPNYDCSGLIQSAFRSAGIQLPRDAYQQEAFVQPVALADLIPGDLVFFGPPEKAKHVGLYLGDGAYIHSSGQDIGRNGIGIDSLSLDRDPISRAYFTQWRGGGRVVQSYCSRGFAACGA